MRRAQPPLTADHLAQAWSQHCHDRSDCLYRREWRQHQLSRAIAGDVHDEWQCPCARRPALSQLGLLWHEHRRAKRQQPASADPARQHGANNELWIEWYTATGSSQYNLSERN